MIKLPHLLLILIILSGCTTQQKLRKAKRLIAEAQAMGATWGADTTRMDTVFITRHKVDTLLTITKVTDTVFVDNIRFIVKNDTILHKIFIKGDREVKRDTIVKEVIINRTIHAPKENKVAPWWRTAAIIDGILLLLILAIIIRRIIK